jgi:hypothetical protein
MSAFASCRHVVAHVLGDGPERDITPFRNYSLPEIRAGYRSLIGGTMRSIRHAIVVALLLLAAVPAAAQSNYPERNIRLLFGFPPGGDTAERLLCFALKASCHRAALTTAFFRK